MAKEDHSYMATAEERKRRENSWVLVLNSQGKNGPMNQREDHAEAKRIKERLYEESGEGNTKIHPGKQVRQRENQPFSRSREPENWMEMVPFCSLIQLVFVVVGVILKMVAGMELG